MEEAIGKSKEGLSTKIHAVCDGLGNSLHFLLTGGQVHDVKIAKHLLGFTDLKGEKVLCDKGYDSTEFVDYIHNHGGFAVIPTRCNSKNPRVVDEHLYKERHLVENLFLKMKNYRRFATRYEKTASSFMVVTLLSAILIWLL